MSNKFMEAVGFEVFKETPNLTQIAATGSMRPEINRSLQNQALQIAGFVDKMRTKQDQNFEDELNIMVDSLVSDFNMGLAQTPGWNSSSEGIGGAVQGYEKDVTNRAIAYLEENRHRMSNDQYQKAYMKLTTRLTNGAIPLVKEYGIAQSKEVVAGEVSRVEAVKSNVENMVLRAPLTGESLREEDLASMITPGLNLIHNSAFKSPEQKKGELLDLVTVHHSAFLQMDIADRILKDVPGRYYGTDDKGNRFIDHKKKLEDLEKTRELLYNPDVIAYDAKKYHAMYGDKYGLTVSDFEDMIYKKNTTFMQEAYPKIHAQVVKHQEDDDQKKRDANDRMFQRQQTALNGLENQLDVKDFLTPVSVASSQNFTYSDVLSNAYVYKDVVSGKDVPLYTITHGIDDIDSFREKGGFIQMPDKEFSPIKEAVTKADSIEQIDSGLSTFYKDVSAKYGLPNRDMMKKSLAKQTGIPLEIIEVNDPKYIEATSGQEGVSQRMKDTEMKTMYLTSLNMKIDFEDASYALKAPLEKMGSYKNVAEVLTSSRAGLTPQEIDVVTKHMVNRFRSEVDIGGRESNPSILIGNVFGHINKTPEALAAMREAVTQVKRLRKKPTGTYKTINVGGVRTNTRDQILKKYPVSEEEKDPETNPLKPATQGGKSGVSQEVKSKYLNKFQQGGL